MDRPSFPVFALDRGRGTLLPYPDQELLTVVTKRAAKERFLCDAELLDVAGQWFEVESFEIVEESYWRRPKTFFGRGIRLTNLRFRHVGPADLDEVKRVFREMVESQRDFWESGVGFDTPEVLARLDRCGSVREVFDVLAPGSTDAVEPAARPVAPARVDSASANRSRERGGRRWLPPVVVLGLAAVAYFVGTPFRLWLPIGIFGLVVAAHFLGTLFRRR